MRSAIDKQPSGRWRARYWVDGKWYPKTFDFEREAKDWLAGVSVSLEKNLWISPTTSRMLFRDWGDEFWRSEVNLARHTIALQTRLYKKHLLPVWGDRPLDSINVRQVLEWSTGLQGTRTPPLAANTCKAIYNVFSKMMRGAVEARILSAAPLPQKRRHLPKAPKATVKILTAPEIDRLVAAIEPRYRALVLCMAYGGFRIGEMFALRLGNVDLEAGTIRVVDTQVSVGGHVFYDEGPKTENSIRTVKLPRAAVTALAAHVLEFVPDTDDRTLVIRPPRGGDMLYSGFHRGPWRRAVLTAGLAPLHPHELRHTAISTWIAEGASLPAVVARSGDSMATAMSVYGHRFPADEDRLLAALDVRIQAAAPVVVGGGNVIALDPARRRKNA